MTRNIYTIDNGNTNPCVGRFNQNILEEVLPLPDFLSQKREFTANSIIVSDVGKRLPPISNSLIAAEEFRHHNMFLGMAINYSESLGPDRLIQAWYLFQKWIQSGNAKSLMLIDAGTFTTMDLITIDGLDGGFIFPGIRPFLETYAQGAKLPKIEKGHLKKIIHSLFTEPKQKIPHDTISSMGQASTIYLQSTLNAVLQQFTPDRIFITGGNGALFHLLQPEAEFDPHLIHHSLYSIHKETVH